MNFDVIYSKTLILRVINSKFNLNQNLFELKEKGTKKPPAKQFTMISIVSLQNIVC